MLLGRPPPGYSCPRCDLPGHWATQCPGVSAASASHGAPQAGAAMPLAPSVAAPAVIAAADHAWFTEWVRHKQQCEGVNVAVRPNMASDARRRLKELEVLYDQLSSAPTEQNAAMATERALATLADARPSQSGRVARKRRWRQRRAARRAAKVEEARANRAERLQQVDVWLAEQTGRLAAEKRAAHEATARAQSLSAARRRHTASLNFLRVVEAVSALRDLRRDKALRRGHFDPETDIAFDEACSALAADARAEADRCAGRVAALCTESALPTSTAASKPAKPLLLRRRRARNRFERYYLHAYTSISRLVNVRRQWDVYLAPPGVPGSSIPADFVEAPRVPSSPEWARWLVPRKPAIRPI